MVSPSPVQIVKMTSQSVKTARMVAPNSNDEDTFLEGIGMVTTYVGPLEKILYEEKSRLLAVALSHIHCGSQHISDPFLQWSR